MPVHLVEFLDHSKRVRGHIVGLHTGVVSDGVDVGTLRQRRIFIEAGRERVLGDDAALTPQGTEDGDESG